MKVELVHQRYLEREKTLYDSRLAAYTEIIKLTSELHDLMQALRGYDSDNASSRQVAKVEETQNAMSGLLRFEHLLPVISGADVVDAFVDLMGVCDRLVQYSERGASVRFPIASAGIWDRLEAEMGRLLEAVRHEIGADLDESMDAKLPARFLSRRGRYYSVGPD